MNDSDHTGDTAGPVGSEFVIISAVIYVVIIIASLFANLTVCVVILRTRPLRRSINSSFILSLAISDLITTCLVMPFDLEQVISDGKWRHGEIMCNVWTTTYLLAVPTSILSLLALTVYRYRLLQDPLDMYKLSPLITRKRASLVISILWTYSMLFSLAPVFGWKTDPRSVMDGYCHFNMSWIYSVASSMLNFMAPVFVTSLLNYRMCCLALSLTGSTSALQADDRSGNNQPLPGSSNTNQTTLSSEIGRTETLLPTPKPIELWTSPQRAEDRQLNRSQHEELPLRKLQKRNTRAAMTTILIVFSFVFCWLPHTLLSITGSFCKECYMTVPNQVKGIFLIMGYLNSAINPVLYSFRSPEFKKAIKLIVGKRSVSSSEQPGSRKTSHSWLSINKTTSDSDRETRL